MANVTETARRMQPTLMSQLLASVEGRPAPRAWECLVTETHRKTVVVHAPTRRDAREMAERGPGAWQDAGATSECIEWQVEAIERQDDGEDEMDALKRREEA